MTAPFVSAAPSAIAARHDLAARDPALPDLALVLDDDARSEALGHRSRIERLRYKRGASIVAAVRTGDDRLLWISSYADRTKLAKSLQRAERSRAATVWLSPTAVAGPAYADRILGRVVRRVFGADAARLGGAEVLRYNPHRRLVLRERDRALKLTERGALPVAAIALAARGLPVLAPERVADGAWAYPWWGDGDLARCDDAKSAERAGAALASLHAAAFAGLPLPGLAAGEVARTAATAIATLLPEYAERASRLAARIAGLPLDGPPVLCHGDWSADQVLTDGRAVRIIDLDRATIAPREYDLGSYLACDGDPALLDGYRAAGGHLDEHALSGWRALALLRRAPEPFRRGHADWPQDVARELARAEEVLP